ncbi:family 20 glycosylhydrolase [candidate division KSB1 bacterium]|nr:family 20 glycosylhydrolase [candidate division KSB1 bacterium]
MKNYPNNEIFVVPLPQKWYFHKGFYKLDKTVPIFAGQDLINSAQLLKECFQTDYQLSLNILPLSQSSIETPGIYLLSPDNLDKIAKIINDDRIKITQKLDNEGYLLIIKDHFILLVAQSPQGAFYGIQTLRMLIGNKKKEILIPELTIHDWPDMKIRGFSDDISRGQVSTLNHFKRIIRYLASYKMNVYMPYIEDIFQFKSYPSIGKNRGALSARECIELQDYAARYYVDIIPVFQTLGHYENMLIQPEFLHLADFPGAASLDVTLDETYFFLEKCLNEIVPVFKSVYFHIGADESYDVGSGASRNDVLKHGIAAVHAKHYNKVFRILKKYNKKIIMYGDIVLEHPDILKDLPRDIKIMDWHYEKRDHYESTNFFQKSGHDYIVSPGNQNWSRIFPDMDHARKNIYNIIRDGHMNGAAGAVTSSWGDFGGANLRELNYYQIAYAANCAWNKTHNNLEQFNHSFFRDFYGSDDPGFIRTFDTLSRVSEYYDLNYFFAHPFYPLTVESNKLERRIKDLEQLYDDLTSELKKLRATANRNKSHLDILEYCVSLYHWTALLNKVQLELNKTQSCSPDLLITHISILEEKLVKIKSTFAELWLRYNKKDNLDRIINLFDRVRKQLTIKKVEIKNGNFELNGRLETPFITFPVDPANASFSPAVYLRKTFSMREPVKKAWLHVIADSHAILWLNGQKVGELLATRTLSAVVEAERVKMWNVAKYLKKGGNVLAVRVINYKQAVKPSINIILNCPEVNSQVTGDETWKILDREEKNWHSPDFVDTNWENAVQAENNWIISRPCFEYEFPARIEFFRNPIY